MKAFREWLREAQSLHTALKDFDWAEADASIRKLGKAFGKEVGVFGMKDKSEAALKPHFYFNSNAVKNALETINNYGYDGIERVLLLLHHYNLKGVGVGDTGTSDASLMKEMVAKMMAKN